MARASHRALPSAADLQLRGDRPVSTWPDGCAEVLVEWSASGDAGADPVRRKVTNTGSTLDGGVPLPDPRPVAVAVRTGTRERGVLELSTALPRSARLRLG